MSIKNAVLKATLRLLPIPKQNEEVPKRILVVTTTALGDTLWATPALASLRTSFPDAFISVLTSPIGMQILKHNPSIDKLHLLRTPFLTWKELIREHFDTVLLFHASQRIVLPLTAAIGAGKIVGTSGINKGLDSLLTHPLPNHFQHEITRRLKIVEAIGGKTTCETLSLYLQPEERNFPLEQGPWIAIHPGSKDRYKRWPISHFAEVARALKKKYKILITGTNEERPIMEELAALVPESRLMPENLSLRSFAALLEKMELLICNDTGPFHLACALDTPVIGIYASTQPALCGPHQAKNAMVISKRPTCDPCLKRKCRIPFCFLQISPHEVIEVALKFLTI